MSKVNTCPLCDNPLKRENRPVEAKYKNSIIKYNQPGDWCNKCKDGFLGPEDLKISRVEIDKLKNEIDKEEN